MAGRAIITFDVGKTVSKLSLWGAAGTLIDCVKRPNARAEQDGIAVLDVSGIEAWLADTLKQFATQTDVGAIIPVAHGAAAALVRHGNLVAPPIDYEASVPAGVRAGYAALRAPFAETGSPALPDGLNLGVQLYRQRALIDADTQILLWPQYWAWRLSGVAVSEMTSLGCHTDLWAATGKPSQLAVDMGWADRLPTLRHAREVLGPITAEWAARTGLPDDTAIHTGLHDSNAALVAARAFPEISDGDATVLSTGTWFVAMRTPAAPVSPESLDEKRDCLINVDVTGRAISSARWMGGREIETQIAAEADQIDIPADQALLIAAVSDVVSGDIMLLPALVSGCGPFSDRAGAWINPPSDGFARRAALCLYAAIVTNVSLDLIGARRAILVEGRFGKAAVVVRALASLRPNDAIYVADCDTDVSFGALRLVGPSLKPQGQLRRVVPLDVDLTAYHARWTERVAA